MPAPQQLPFDRCTTTLAPDTGPSPIRCSPRRRRFIELPIVRLRIVRLPILSLLIVGLMVSCAGGRSDADRAVVAGGDPDRGAVAIEEAGCGSCHRIPGIDRARGLVGPPLDGWSRRGYIAGRLPNGPDNLIRWVMDPRRIEPGTAMPDLALTEQQARDIAAYLYTLR